MHQTKTTPQDETFDDESQQVLEDEVQRLTQDLPETFLSPKVRLVNYQGFWFPDHSNYLPSILAFQRHFRGRDTDLIIASFPKTGTTWLKSLLFSVVNRDKYDFNQSPLLKIHPHELVSRIEPGMYGNAIDDPRSCYLNYNEVPSPRLSNTHLPYISLPESLKESRCKLIYISRNPMDTLVSNWHFTTSAMKKIEGEDYEFLSIEEFFEHFIQGKVVHGPFFEHVAEYWKQSLKQPDKVLFLKYEDLKDDPVAELKKLGEFVGMPFSTKEEKEGVIEEIVKLCSIGNLKEMEVNKNGVFNKFFEKKSYFRKGEVGGWRQYFTPFMVQRMDKLMKEKSESIGLSFKLGN